MIFNKKTILKNNKFKMYQLLKKFTKRKNPQVNKDLNIKTLQITDKGIYYGLIKDITDKDDNYNKHLSDIIEKIDL